MKQYSYSPISFGLASYGFGVMPLGLYMLGVLPTSFLPAVLIHMLIFAGLGQILTGFIFKNLLIKTDSVLFTLYGFHWATSALLDLLSLSGVIKFKFYSLFSFIAIITTVAFMMPSALKSSMVMAILYMTSLLSLVMHVLAMFEFAVFAPWAGLFYMIATTLALYAAASEVTTHIKGYRILPLGRALMTQPSEATTPQPE